VLLQRALDDGAHRRRARLDDGNRRGIEHHVLNAKNHEREAYLVDKADDLRPEWVEGKRSIGVTAGASAPEVLVHDVILRLQEMGVRRVRELEGIDERVTFPLPKGIAHGGS